MIRSRRERKLPDMPVYLLHHQHEPGDCATAFAAWQGFDSPLRHRPVISSCVTGGHALWWRVSAANPLAALALLPAFVAGRATATEVRDFQIP